MGTIGKILGYILALGGYLYCFVMLWVNVIQWWGWSAVGAFLLSPILAVFIPLIAWIVEGTFPSMLLAGWGAIVVGVILLGLTSKSSEE